MKAIICTKYGPPDVLKLGDVEKPIPKKNELCIKVYATAVTASDIYIRSSDIPVRFRIPMRLMLGIMKPRKSILGLANFKTEKEYILKKCWACRSSCPNVTGLKI